ncbi:serine hydrolase [Emticicia soli]|uniref:Serine hydrolase n=1 Tax=Emticicia soli TaxID=2027878 RepID=A0ABW5J820_9BACT
MKKLTIVLMLLCQLGFAQSKQKQVDDFLLRQLHDSKIPGMQVAVVQKGKIVFSKAYGIANIQDNVQVDNKTIFAINSCTKAFTGVAIMQLVEEGKLDLNAPISSYIDSLPAQWQPVKIQQLLTHISGLPDILRIQEPAGANNEAKTWKKVTAMPMDFPTGEQFSYNQTNYVLLGKVISKLRGKPFAQVFKEQQFDVVGMPNTVFGDSRDVIPHFAPTYSYKKYMDGYPLTEAKLTNNYAEFAPSRRTGSGLNSTAEEMAKWIIALQTGKLLKTKEALKTMWLPITFNNGKPTNWALGWGVNKFRPKHWAVGMSGGGRSAFLVYPDDDLAVIALTNLGGSAPENWLEELAGIYNAEIPAADPITMLRIELNKRGYDKAPQILEEIRKKDPTLVPDENELNDWAYRVMGDRPNDALELFKINVALYPNSWNVYDSLGEALLKTGNKAEAIKMYQKSVDLNPNNKGGKQMLERLSK